VRSGGKAWVVGQGGGEGGKGWRLPSSSQGQGWTDPAVALVAELLQCVDDVHGALHGLDWPPSPTCEVQHIH
jgi:hypothetical protein